MGGQSIGVLLQTEGVTIVGFSAVETATGQINPAEDAGLMEGDFITKINGSAVKSNADVAASIVAAGEGNLSCRIEYLRNGISHEVEVKPAYCLDSQSYRIGLYVRDNTAGVGTLTFWDAESGVYGALGHGVSDLEHGVTDEQKGTIIRAAIQGIRMGSIGSPGEKLGVFLDEEWQGCITSNGEYGIYGYIDSLPVKSSLLLPVAEMDEVENGAAELYTVINGEEIACFQIEITKIGGDFSLSNRGMVIEITDESLLALTGGIIQGMSGSPIVQEDKLIGAVTHVFVNDPTQGYACYAQQMMEEAGL